MADDFDVAGYEDIAKTIPDVGYGPEMELGKGAASVGESAFIPDFSKLDSSVLDWSSVAAEAVKGATQIGKSLIEKEAGKQPGGGSTIPAVQGSGSVTSRTNFPAINLPVPDVKPAAPPTAQPAAPPTAQPAAPPTAQPAVAMDNTALYVGLGLGAAALTVGVAVALSRRSRKRRAV